MTVLVPTPFAVTAAILAFTAIAVRLFKPSSASSDAETINSKSKPVITREENLSEALIVLIKKLQSELPAETVLSRDHDFQQSTRGHWAEQECEKIPACVVQPRTGDQLAITIKLLSESFNRRDQTSATLSTTCFFAVRSGGHSPVAGAASASGGILIDLSYFNEVKVSDDRESVSIGTGARWADVSTILDSEGLAAVGGRNSHVGVGGLVLGGGISYFSPQFGLVCSNILEYEIVLASGHIAKASSSENPKLWRALKGGANNFGVVTRFTARCFPSTGVWGGCLYIPSFQAEKLLATFNESVTRADPRQAAFDKHAAGVIVSFTYVQPIGVQVACANLIYTKPPKDATKWPDYWRSSSFPSIWRFWSTCKARTLTSATNELASLNPPGRRQALTATTTKNDLDTLNAVYSIFRQSLSTIRRVKGISWTLVVQPLFAEWARKGDPNSLGLDEGTSEPLVIVSLTINWPNAKDDDFVNSEAKRVMEEVEAFAEAHDTAHRYRYLNYCASWQDPFKGYGANNLEFLREVSREYDPEGLFQKACTGGFKL